MASYDNNAKEAFTTEAARIGNLEQQGRQAEDYPRHGEPADAAAMLTLDNELSDMNMRIETLEQLFNQAEYEERYWSIKRDNLADALISLREAREIVRQRLQTLPHPPASMEQPTTANKTEKTAFMRWYADRV